MKVSRNWLQTYFDKSLPSIAELDKLFTFHSFEIEGIEEVKDDSGKVLDHVIDAKLNADRNHYALSHRGMAYEVAALTDLVIKKNRIPKGPDALIENKPEIKILEPDFCRRYMGRYVELKNASSGPGTCAMLQAVGQRAINAIVDASNMVMLDVGQPMHAFDADKVKGGIIVRKAAPGEKMILLDGQEVMLNDGDHVIADSDGPLAIAGVKGGKRAEVTLETKRIIIESANFEPTAVRRTSTRLNLRNESSKRYENEITPELTAVAMDNISALIAEFSPEAKFGPIVDVYPVKAERVAIDMEPSYISLRLGMDIPEEEIKRILAKLDISVTEEGKNWKLTVPYERMDLRIKEDIVEEVGRIYGYDHIKGILPPQNGKEAPILASYYVAERVKNALIASGYSEVSLYSLVAKGDIETAKPLAKDKAFLRTNLKDGMMNALSRNALNADLLGAASVKLFEIGRVFEKTGEKTKLAIGAVQVKKVKGMNGEVIIKTALESILEDLGIDLNLPKLAVNGNAYVAEIDLDDLVSKTKLLKAAYSDLNFGKCVDKRFVRYSNYPFIVRDVAIFVPESESSDAVWKQIEIGLEKSGGKDLLIKSSLFDVFKKDGKTSYAYRLIFQSFDRTLTDDEANGFMQSVHSTLKEKGYEVR